MNIFTLIIFLFHMFMGTYTVTQESEMWIEGTSTIHDWRCDVTQINGKFETNGSVRDFDVLDATISIDVPSITCSKGSVMEKKMREALKADDEPTITFNFLADNDTKVTGNVMIAGKSLVREIRIEGVGYTLEKTKVRVKGYAEINMRDFDVSPPTALARTIKTDPNVVIHFIIYGQL